MSFVAPTLPGTLLILSLTLPRVQQTSKATLCRRRLLDTASPTTSNKPAGAVSMEGKVCVVTGSTQGIGEAIARAFAAKGASGLVICGRNAKLGEAVAQDIHASWPKCEVLYVRGDLADADQTKGIISQADAKFGRIDVLVNAAGTTERGTLLDTTVELYDRIMAINTRAPFLLMQGAARVMKREKVAGSIVNIQSMSAHGGQPFICPYAVSKGALATLTKNAAFGLMPDRIRVNGLNIGWSDTPGEDSIMKRCHGAQDGWQAKAASEQPFGRLISTAEVARACVYLASDESGLLTGSNIDFDQSVIGCYDSPPHPAQPIRMTGGGGGDEKEDAAAKASRKKQR